MTAGVALQVGDVLEAVEGSAVDQRTLDAIKQLTIGPEGSTVTLHMLRGGQTPYTCTLQRMLPEDGGGRP
jgi:C-terminal processing protease CtpA/Prc